MMDPTPFRTRSFEQVLNDGPGAIFEHDVLNRRTMTDMAPCQRTDCSRQADEFEGLRWHSAMTPWLQLEPVLIFGDTGLPVNT